MKGAGGDHSGEPYGRDGGQPLIQTPTLSHPGKAEWVLGGRSSRAGHGVLRCSRAKELLAQRMA